MSTELSSQPERPEDQPLDALVYDVHPALAGRHAQGDYPYDPPGGSPFQVRPQDIYRPPSAFKIEFHQPPPAEYVVPQRFGLSAILGIMTALAILFGIMHWLAAEPGWYLFLGAQSVVICLVQMFHGKTPRQASAAAGAIMAPLFVLGTAWTMQNPMPAGGVLCSVVACVPLGGFLGYLNGTCAAGIFLVMDKLEPYLQGRRPIAPLAGSTPNIPAT